MAGWHRVKCLAAFTCQLAAPQSDNIGLNGLICVMNIGLSFVIIMIIIIIIIIIIMFVHLIDDITHNLQLTSAMQGGTRLYTEGLS